MRSEQFLQVRIATCLYSRREKEDDEYCIIFFRRCRKVESGKTPYQLLTNSFVPHESRVLVDLLNKDTGVTYELQFSVLKDSTFRLHINEKNPLHPRYESKYALHDQPQRDQFDTVVKTIESITMVKDRNKVVVNSNPFRVDLYSQDVLTISANARGLMRFEHLRTKPER